MMSITEELFMLAKEIADNTPTFDMVQGPGEGNRATDEYISQLNGEVEKKWPLAVIVDEPVAEEVGYTFDFYIPSEETVVEIALLIKNPNSEFEKDIFKAILAKDAGKKIKTLILIGRNGSVKRQKASGPTAIMAFVQRKFKIKVEVRDL